MTNPRAPRDMGKWNKYAEEGTGGSARAVRALPWVAGISVVLSVVLAVYAAIWG